MKKSDAPEALLAAANYVKPMTRNDVTELIVMARIKKGLTWAKLAKAIGESKEWTTAALLGQMQLTKEQATTAGKLLAAADAVLLRQQVRKKALADACDRPTHIPMVRDRQLYGTTIRADTEESRLHMAPSISRGHRA